MSIAAQTTLNPFAFGAPAFVQTGRARNCTKTTPPKASVEANFTLHLPGGVGSEIFQTFPAPRTQVEQQGQGGLVFSSGLQRGREHQGEGV